MTVGDRDIGMLMIEKHKKYGFILQGWDFFSYNRNLIELLHQSKLNIKSTYADSNHILSSLFEALEIFSILVTKIPVALHAGGFVSFF